MPTIVRVDGANAAHRSLNIPERQVLLRMDGTAEGYWSHILFHRVEGSRWITCEPDLSIQVEDLAGEEIIPIPADAPMPQAGRPYLCFDMMDEPTLAGLRARAAQLAEVHGVVIAVPVGLPSSSGWFFADTAYVDFGKEVPTAVLGAVGRVVYSGNFAIVRIDVSGDPEFRAVAEKVERLQHGTWKAAKQSGLGRDKRLSPVSLGSHGSPALFADAYRLLLAPTSLADEIFEGPSAFMELARSVVASGMETQGFAAQFLSTSGVNVKSSAAIVYRYVMQAIYFMVCVDRLNAPQLASAEHLARWALQYQRAIRKNNKVPDFGGLEGYMAHATELSGIVQTPGFDKHIAERQKTETAFLKQQRQSKEEDDAVEKQRKKGGKNE